VRTCASLASINLPNTQVTLAREVAADATTPASCRVTLRVHDPVDSGVVTVWVHLPMTTWNGRFQGVGGGGFLGGSEDRMLPALAANYAVGATDAGHAGATADFALNADGTLNWPAIEDFGHEGVHDMTVTAKAVTAAFYGRSPAYSYWNGCSTGGRQGLMEIQRHPDSYDGVLAGAPVINFDEMQTAQIWGQVAMLDQDNPVAMCKFATALAAEVAACDTIGDGVVDGVIGDPLACEFDLASLVGTPTDCGVITAADATIMALIREGARRTNGGFLWYGLAPGAPFEGLNNTVVGADGQLVGSPFTYDIWWFTRFLKADLGWDWTTLTRADFEASFDLAMQRYDELMGADDPDLSAFRDNGGKLLMWHGAADFGVMYQGTLDYYEKVRDLLGPGKTQQFARLFIAPGVGHCSGGAGPELTDPLSALVSWVERGHAPRTLEAAKVVNGVDTQQRPVCMYPFVAKWTGRGDPNDGSTFRCVPGSRLEPTART
jgi:feruloyl esterase